METPINLDDVVSNSNTSGLANMRSTCYVNTAIQCLGFCPKFFKYVIAGSPRKPNTPFTNELKEIFVELWIRKNSIAPMKFLKSLNNTFEGLMNIYEQNDVSEFVILYLDKLNADLGVELLVDNKDIQKIKQTNKKNYTNHAFAELCSIMDIAWLNSIKKEFSPIIDMFYGQVISQIVCGNCEHIHHNYENHCGLSLPISESQQTLNDLLNTYFADETLNCQDNNWKCDKCNTYCNSKKTTKLWRNPSILIITLKRFDHSLSKNKVNIDVPETVDLSSYCLYTKNRIYNLVSVCVHKGSFGGGHYVAVCKHRNGKWFLIDDLSVNEATKYDVENALNNGYMYFYEVAH